MNNTPYNQLRQILTDRLPHLKKLSFGCQVIYKNDTYNVLKFENETLKCVSADWEEKEVSFIEYDCEIIGHPPTLQDVLLAIETNTQGGELHLHTYADKLLIGHYERKNKEGHYSHCYYDLTKPLSDQSDETLLAIIELLR